MGARCSASEVGRMVVASDLHRVATACGIASSPRRRDARRMLRLGAVVLLSLSSLLAQEQGKPDPSANAAPKQAPEQDQKPKDQKPKDPALVPEGAAGLDPLQLARAMTSTMKLALPGPQHERLQKLEGAYAVSMQLTPPGLPAQECLGEARAMTVLGGRYLLVNLKVRVAGVVMEGLYVFGYDNLRSLYTVSWRDSLSTWSVECAGPETEGQKDKVALSGTMVDAASPTGRSFDLELSFLADGFSLSVRDQVKEAKVEVMRQTFSKKAIETTQEPADRKK
jgi:hypothetical protein